MPQFGRKFGLPGGIPDRVFEQPVPTTQHSCGWVRGYREHQDHLVQFDGRIQRGRDSAEHLADARYSNDSRSIFGPQTMNLHNVDYDMRD